MTGWAEFHPDQRADLWLYGGFCDGESPLGFLGSSDIDYWPHALGLTIREAPTQVERLAGPLLPLASEGRAYAAELADSEMPERVWAECDTSCGCYRDVPDWPAVSLFQSLITAVDGQHDRVETSWQDPRKPGVHRLSGKAAVMLKGGTLVLVHGLTPFACLMATARTSGRREAPHRSQIWTVIRWSHGSPSHLTTKA